MALTHGISSLPYSLWWRDTPGSKGKLCFAALLTAEVHTDEDEQFIVSSTMRNWKRSRKLP